MTTDNHQNSAGQNFKLEKSLQLRFLFTSFLPIWRTLFLVMVIIIFSLMNIVFGLFLVLYNCIYIYFLVYCVDEISLFVLYSLTISKDSDDTSSHPEIDKDAYLRGSK